MRSRTEFRSCKRYMHMNLDKADLLREYCLTPVLGIYQYSYGARRDGSHYKMLQAPEAVSYTWKLHNFSLLRKMYNKILRTVLSPALAAFVYPCRKSLIIF